MIKRQKQVNYIEEGLIIKNNAYIYQKNNRFSFQGKYAISHHWFKLDLDWVIKNLNTIEP